MFEETLPLVCIPSHLDARDWVFEPEDEALSNPPASIDLREIPDGFPGIFTQGELNSCTANAVAAALYYDMRRAGLSEAFCPSRLFIYYNERKDEVSIGLDSRHGRPVQMRTCIQTVSTEGVCSEEVWPYDAVMLDQCPPDTAYGFAKTYRAQTYHRLQQDLAHLKACLASGFPFVFGARLYPNFPSHSSTGNSTVLLPTAFQQPMGGHALLAVGYDDARGAFIVRNSWGSAWGDGGHCYFPYEYLTNPAWAFDHWVINALADNSGSPELPDSPPAAAPLP